MVRHELASVLKLLELRIPRDTLYMIEELYRKRFRLLSKEFPNFVDTINLPNRPRPSFKTQFTAAAVGTAALPDNQRSSTHSLATQILVTKWFVLSVPPTPKAYNICWVAIMDNIDDA